MINMNNKSDLKQQKLFNENSIIKIMIVEDNRFVRIGWESVIQANKYFNLVGSFPDCESAFNSDIPQKANLVLMDIGLPGISGIEGVKYLKEKFPNILIVMCTVHEDSEEIFQAICAGAVGYLTKRTSPEELIKSLIEAYNGGSPMTPSVARKVIGSFQNIKTSEAENNISELNDREKQILNLMAQGKSYNVIANEVYLSIDGVYYHIRHIYEKLHVHSRAEAVAQGIKKRIIQITK
jgi:DNA-binding NarL/FixJ family response regulator